MKKSVKKVSWFDDEHGDDIYDNHTHSMRYLDSEHLSPEKIKKNQEDDRINMSRFTASQEMENFGI